jgi:hypothetical protein
MLWRGFHPAPERYSCFNAVTGARLMKSALGLGYRAAR